MKKSIIIILAFFVLFQISKADPLLDAAEKELKRSMTELQDEETPPYFLSYQIFDTKQAQITAAFGHIESNMESHQRKMDIDLRVGSHKFDNTHIIRGNPFSFSSSGGAVELPLESDEKAIRSAIWFATDARYKNAIERYEKALSNSAVKVREDDTSADFSHEKPYKYIEDEINYNINKEKWEKILKNISSIFSNYEWIYSSQVALSSNYTTKYFVSSEGSRLRWNEYGTRIMIFAKTKAEDGMSLPLYESFYAFDPKDLPGEEELKNKVQEIIDKLSALRKAPIAETFTGPAILSGEASGVFFHEIFGHRIEGHREKDPNSSQTFKQSVGEKILPEFMHVVFDPTLKNLANTDLAGYYKYDDEGIEAQYVDIVKDGVFRNFLMSRSPIENFENSNGHGRRQVGYQAVSRQSNLIVKTSEVTPKDELREILIEECKKQDKEYGLYFEKVSGGFTFTSRVIPNSFNVTPLVVYKIYADGRPDELVRGVDLIGTPLTTFSNIIAAGDDVEVFNGMCGAESGRVPVSASSPSILVNKIEVQKKKKSQAKPPILDSPTTAGQKNY